jgi:protein-S-isoprenylcysteine O-methyltransferase Ste14
MVVACLQLNLGVSRTSSFRNVPDLQSQGLSLAMNPWIAKMLMLAGSMVLVAIRAPHGQRSRSVKVAKSRRGGLEIVLLTLAWFGFVVPLIWIASSALSFADYPLRTGPFLAGLGCIVVGLWMFYRSHADLGTNWSITLEVREGHRLITQGVYSHIRHPMYAALLIYSVGQSLVLPNWIAGPSYLITFAILYVFRVRAEERLMLEQFGDEYAAYMARTPRLLPRVGQFDRAG